MGWVYIGVELGESQRIIKNIAAGKKGQAKTKGAVEFNQDQEGIRDS